MKQVVCLSTSNFHPFPSRKQNVMTRLRDCRVLYFDPPVSWLAPLKDKNARSRLRDHRRPPSPATESVTVCALPPVLPFFNKLRFINRINQRRLARFVKKKMRELGFDQPLLWCYSPTSCDIVDRLPHRGLVYDCVDRHSAYPGFIDPQVVDSMEQDLARRADTVFCTAQGLYDTLKEYNDKTYLIPNGVNFDLFSQAAGEGSRQRPVFGFVGMLQECIAYDYLLALADAIPEAEIILVGRTLPGVDISGLQRRPNIRMLGLLPQEDLPGVMKDFNVCLNLFAPGKLSQDVSPLKFYEYLATGKPLVSTREPRQVEDYAELIYIADDIPAFLDCCRRALAEDDPELREGRIQAAAAAAWDKRVKQMEDLLLENQVGGR